MSQQNRLAIAKKAAYLAGSEIIRIYENSFEHIVEMKEDNSPLTIADKTSNDVIIRMLRDEFPDISILSEENTSDTTRFNNDWCWIIDPLDGTKEFLKKSGEFTVNIALSYKGRAIIGVIYLPVLEVLYYAAEGIGAYKEEKGQAQKICVSDKTDELILVGSKSHSTSRLKSLISEKEDLIAETISAGSSLKGVMVAEGAADVYYRFGNTCEWDTAAMQCIVEQAGGVFRQLDGSEMTYNRRNSLNEKVY